MPHESFEPAFRGEQASAAERQRLQDLVERTASINRTNFNQGGAGYYQRQPLDVPFLAVLSQQTEKSPYAYRFARVDVEKTTNPFGCPTPVQVSDPFEQSGATADAYRETIAWDLNRAADCLVGRVVELWPVGANAFGFSKVMPLALTGEQLRVVNHVTVVPSYNCQGTARDVVQQLIVLDLPVSARVSFLTEGVFTGVAPGTCQCVPSSCKDLLPSTMTMSLYSLFGAFSGSFPLNYDASIGAWVADNNPNHVVSLPFDRYLLFCGGGGLNDIWFRASLTDQTTENTANFGPAPAAPFSTLTPLYLYFRLASIGYRTVAVSEFIVIVTP